jgi:energy-coupling factor transporter ATP-binding protein EcfA2
MIDQLITYYQMAKEGKDLMDNSNKYKDYLLRNFWRRNRKILIMGPSGCGKSQFLGSLLSTEPPIPERTQGVEYYNIPFLSYPLNFIDTPGQVTKDFLRKDELDKFHNGSGFDGLINICSYGYLESPDAGRKTAVPNNTISEKFLSENRTLELNFVNEWLTEIRPNKNIKWIINLVTKADIWWDNYDFVMDYYINGAYFKKLNSINGHVPIYTFAYCSIIKPFFETERSKTFGEIEKRTLKNQLVYELTNRLKYKK